MEVLSYLDMRLSVVCATAHGDQEPHDVPRKAGSQGWQGKMAEWTSWQVHIQLLTPDICIRICI